MKRHIILSLCLLPLIGGSIAKAITPAAIIKQIRTAIQKNDSSLYKDGLKQYNDNILKKLPNQTSKNKFATNLFTSVIEPQIALTGEVQTLENITYATAQAIQNLTELQVESTRFYSELGKLNLKEGNKRLFIRGISLLQSQLKTENIANIKILFKQIQNFLKNRFGADTDSIYLGWSIIIKSIDLEKRTNKFSTQLVKALYGTIFKDELKLLHAAENNLYAHVGEDLAKSIAKDPVKSTYLQIKAIRKYTEEICETVKEKNLFFNSEKPNKTLTRALFSKKISTEIETLMSRTLKKAAEEVTTEELYTKKRTLVKHKFNHYVENTNKGSNRYTQKQVKSFVIAFILLTIERKTERYLGVSFSISRYTLKNFDTVSTFDKNILLKK